MLILGCFDKLFDINGYFFKKISLWCFNFFICQQNVLYFWFILIITWQFSWSSFQVLYEFHYCEPSTISVQKIVWKWVAMPNYSWNMAGLMKYFLTILIWFIYQVCIHLPYMYFRITVLIMVLQNISFCNADRSSFSGLIWWIGLVGKSFWSFFIQS